MGESFRLHSQALVGYVDDIEASSGATTPSMTSQGADEDSVLYWSGIIFTVSTHPPLPDTRFGTICTLAYPPPLFHLFKKNHFLCHIITILVFLVHGAGEGQTAVTWKFLLLLAFTLLLSCFSSFRFAFLIPSSLLLPDFFPLSFVAYFHFLHCGLLFLFLPFFLRFLFCFYCFCFCLFSFASSGPIHFGWVDGHLATNIRAGLGANIGLFYFSRRFEKRIEVLLFWTKQNQNRSRPQTN